MRKKLAKQQLNIQKRDRVKYCVHILHNPSKSYDLAGPFSSTIPENTELKLKKELVVHGVSTSALTACFQVQNGNRKI